MTDQDTIRTAIREWGAAFCAKDIDRLMAHYAPDAVVFDAIPPFSSGVAEMRDKVIACFPYFPNASAIETREMKIASGGEMAMSHFMWHFTGLPPGHPAGKHWLRSSIQWRRQPDGRWLIEHDHCSAPFDPHSEKVLLDPDAPATTTEDCAARNPVGWFEIYVQDMARARAFYGAVLGLELTRLEAPQELWAFPMRAEAGGAAGALVHMEGFRSGDNSVLVYFSCEDCAVEAARVPAAGGKIHEGKKSIGEYGHIALVIDSEGNMIGLHSMK